MYKVISFGQRCSSASFISLLGFKTESYPFDWIISKLDVVQHCIETKFVHFLNENNYITKPTEACNIIDNTKYHICNESTQINTYYETYYKNDPTNTYTYKYKLALPHHNLNNVDTHEYYQRCIVRLYELFEMDIRKYYIHFYPIVGIYEFINNKDQMLIEFDIFSQFIINQTTNIFGIYFIFTT